MRRFLPHSHTQASILISLLFTVFVFSSNALAQVRTDPCEAYIELLRNTPPSDQKPGSILFFAKYISDAIDPIHETHRFISPTQTQREMWMWICILWMAAPAASRMRA